MADEQISVDGWDLDAPPVRTIRSRDGIWTTAPVRGALTSTYLADGAIWSPGGADVATLQVTVDFTGSSRSNVLSHYDELVLRLMPGEVNEIVRTAADLTQRRAGAVVAKPLEVAWSGLLDLTVVVEFTLTTGVWEDTADVTPVVATPSAGPYAVPLLPWYGGTAPGLPVVTCEGPWTDPEVVDGRTGVGWLWPVTVPAGETVTVDAHEQSATSTFGADPALIVYGSQQRPTSRYVEVTGATPSLIVDGTGWTGATEVTVEGRRRYR